MFLRKRELTTTQVILLGFLASIMIGAFLLMLPISQAPGQDISPLDALFTATTSVCVTGLVTVPTASAWSLFGQFVILVLVQVGGLGVITFTVIVMVIMGQRITLKERLLLKDAYNLDTLSGLVRLTRRIILGTLLIEAIGALCYAVAFIPQYGFVHGVVAAIFNAVSAFCNAGMDLLGDNSLIDYRTSVLVSVVTMLLIIIGGIGFPVWWDLLEGIERKKREQRTELYDRAWYDVLRDYFQKLELHTKLVLSITAALIFGGMVFILIIEWNNPDTLGPVSIPQKCLDALFQSVTTRTAGFLTIPQENFTDAASMIFLVLMFIGGSPCGTAGGVKTITVYMMVRASVSAMKGRNSVEVFHRRIDFSYIKKGMSIVLFSLAGLFLSIILLCIVQKADFLDIVYECTSAIATVGLSRSLTGNLNTLGKLIIIATMYAGRVGPISLALFFNSREGKESQVKYPEGKIRIG